MDVQGTQRLWLRPTVKMMAYPSTDTGPGGSGGGEDLFYNCIIDGPMYVLYVYVHIQYTYVAYAGPYLQGVDRCESAAEDSSLHLQ
jgi:hypothetical protein